MTSELIFNFIVAFIVFEFLLERLLAYLNSTKWNVQIPEKLKDIYSAKDYEKSQHYEKAKHKLGFYSTVISTSFVLLFLFLGGFAYLDAELRTISAHPIVLSLMFFGVLGFLSDLISTPLSLYHTFVIEERFGFNKTNLKTFILDKLKSYALVIILGGGILSLIVWIYMLSGVYFWLIAWIVLSVFMIFMSMLYSTLIVPLFNKQTPLEEGELRSAIQDFADKVDFKLNNIYVIDGSKRSSKANAYFSGLGPQKRIVLYDTLIKDHTIEELVAVLAHEVGHYKKKHSLIGMITSIAQSGLMLFILSLCIESPLLSQALGVPTQSFHLSVLAFGILYTPISLILGLLTNFVSRKHEYEADRFAKEEYDSGALIDALKRLSVNNLSNLTPHNSNVIFYYSHPPLLKRIEALEEN